MIPEARAGYILRASHIPAHTASSPARTLETIYTAAVSMRPSRRRAMFSLQKVENVVKPPQKPTVRNSLVSALTACPAAASSLMKPISRHPTMLTADVAHG